MGVSGANPTHGQRRVVYTLAQVVLIIKLAARIQTAQVLSVIEQSSFVIVNIPVRRSRSSGETETACPELGTAIK